MNDIIIITLLLAASIAAFCFSFGKKGKDSCSDRCGACGCGCGKKTYKNKS